MFARADQHTAQTGLLRTTNVVLDIVPNHDRLVRLDANSQQRLLEKCAIWLAQNRCTLARRQFQGMHVGAAIQLQALACAPVEIGMGRKQHRSIHQHSECMVHRLVGEQFFSSANHNDVGARFDQCYSHKIPGSIAFSQQPAALSWIVLANIGSGCYRSGHHPLLGKRQTNSLEVPHQRCTRTGSRIGNETSPVALALQPLQGLGCASNWLHTDMQYAIDVEKYATKRRHRERSFKWFRNANASISPEPRTLYELQSQLQHVAARGDAGTNPSHQRWFLPVSATRLRRYRCAVSRDERHCAASASHSGETKGEGMPLHHALRVCMASCQYCTLCRRSRSTVSSSASKG